MWFVVHVAVATRLVRYMRYCTCTIQKTYREDYVVAELASSSSHLMYCSYNFAASIELAINLHDESLHDCFVAIVLHMSAIVRPTVGDVRPTFGVV